MRIAPAETPAFPSCAEHHPGGALWSPFATVPGYRAEAHPPAAHGGMVRGGVAGPNATASQQEEPDGASNTLLLLGGGLAVAGLTAWLVSRWR